MAAKNIKVKYTGLSTKRIIGKEDFKKLGIDIKEDLVFEPINDHTVVIDNPSDKIVTYFTKIDKSFKVEGLADAPKS